MMLQIIYGDITKIECDAIVNAANSTLLGGGGVDGAIHKTAGKGLLLECMKLGGCKVGKAKITKGYKMPCKYIIHTVGPKWKGGNKGERELLKSCYIESLRLAVKNNCQSIAFPLISAGIYGYPKEEALQVAKEVVESFDGLSGMEVYMVLYEGQLEQDYSSNEIYVTEGESFAKETVELCIEGLQQTLRFQKELIKIGSAQDNDVIFFNGGILLQHAAIVCRNGQWYVTDYNSFYGTWLNDSILQANVLYPLKSGDVINLGMKEKIIFNQMYSKEEVKK